MLYWFRKPGNTALPCRQTEERNGSGRKGSLFSVFLRLPYRKAILMKKLLSVLLCAMLLFTSAAPVFAGSTAAGEAAEDLPFENSEFFTTGAYTLHYRVFTPEEAKGQIFMIHGFALSSYCFEALAKEMVSRGYTCVLADLPDFGYSTRETVEMEKLPREDLMHALMTYLSPDPWFVAGHSMGGYVALALAEKYPESVKNLLLYGTSGNDGADGARGALMQNAAFIRVMGPMMEAMGKCAPLVRMLYAVACNDLSFAMRYDVSKITDPYYIEGTGVGAIVNFSMLTPTNYEAVRAMPPILFLNGGSDAVITDAARESLRAALPAGSVDITVPGAGHMVIETHASQVADMTAAFLKAA